MIAYYVFQRTLTWTVLFAAICSGSAGKKASYAQNVFDRPNATEGSYTTNQVPLEGLQSPISIISALGVSKTGKSTALNLFSYLLAGANKSYTEIFERGHSVEPVTRGILMHALPRRDGKGSIIFMDCEGLDVGDETLIRELGITTRLVSSTLIIFVDNLFDNDVLNFLFHLTHVSHDILGESGHTQNPNLVVVVRDGLKPPQGQTLEEYTTNYISEPSFDGGAKGMREKRAFIARYFPKAHISVFRIPFVDDSRLFEDFPNKLPGTDYWKSMERIAQEIEKFPAKKAPNGSLVDGPALHDILLEGTEILNRGSPSLRNNYLYIEEQICKRWYTEIVTPVLALNASEIYIKMEDTRTRFMSHCALESEVTAAWNDLQQKANFTAELERLERGKKAAELGKQKAEEKLEKYVHELRHKSNEKEKELQELKKLRELTETSVRVWKQKVDEINGTIQMLNKSVYHEKGRSAKLISAELKITDLETRLEEVNNRTKLLEKMLDELSNKTETDWSEKVTQILNATKEVVDSLRRFLEVPSVHYFTMAIFGIFGIFGNFLRRRWNF